jgi:hypothetical protein
VQSNNNTYDITSSFSYYCQDQMWKKIRRRSLPGAHNAPPTQGLLPLCSSLSVSPIHGPSLALFMPGENPQFPVTLQRSHLSSSLIINLRENHLPACFWLICFEFFLPSPLILMSGGLFFLRDILNHPLIYSCSNTILPVQRHRDARL